MGGGTNHTLISELTPEQANDLSKFIDTMSLENSNTNIKSKEELAKVLDEKIKNKSRGNELRLAMILGMLTKNKEIKSDVSKDDRSIYTQVRYKFLLDAPFEISNSCCNIMKKSPGHAFYKKTGKAPMTAQMASESRLRTQKWIENGCNGFNLTIPTSNPMSFWTEQDVLLYIKINNLPICSVYGDIVTVDGEEVDGQKSLADFGLFDKDVPTLKTTGCSRTGCMFCGYGAHLEKTNGRFEKMKETHPKIYDYIMRPLDKGGLNYKEVIDWMNEHGNLNIKY